MVSLTRDPSIAEYWARLRRDDDEGIGAVLILDQKRLRHQYRVSPFRDEAWHQSASRTERDEAEEIIVGRPIENLRKYLIGVRWHFAP